MRKLTKYRYSIASNSQCPATEIFSERQKREEAGKDVKTSVVNTDLQYL